jgi:hypothetical protein
MINRSNDFETRVSRRKGDDAAPHSSSGTVNGKLNGFTHDVGIYHA